MPELLLRLLTASWNGLPIASLAIFAVGSLLYLAMSNATSAPTRTRSLANRRPGWIARRRARAGIVHRQSHVGVGYTSATRSVHLTPRELAGHGLVVGGPGSGKTTFLQLVIEASAGRTPVVVVDPKGSPALEETVRAHGGLVWTLDGKLPADLLDPRPWQVPDLLLEAEDYSANARVYRDAAHQRALWAAWALTLDGHPMDLAELRRLLDRTELKRALDRHRGRDSRIAEWMDHLEHQHGGIEDSGARGLDRALGTLLDGVAIRGSLRACPEALRLEDVLETPAGLVLFKLDAADYPHATRKVASWILLGMGRIARQLPPPTGGEPRALLLVDEVGALGHSARHLRGLVGRARESGLATVLATQGPSDLEAVDRALLPQVLQDTAWQLAFRQGSPQDATHMQAVFGQAWTEDLTRWSDGRSSSRYVERPRVSIDEWMNALEPGDAWLRVGPVDRGWRQEHVRVALPTRIERSDRTPDIDSDSYASDLRYSPYPMLGPDSGVVRPEPTEPASPLPGPTGGALPAVPPDCPAELIERMGSDVVAKVERRWPRRRHELGACLVWTGPQVVDKYGNVYGRLYDAGIGRTDYTHRVVWRRVYGPIPLDGSGRPLPVDHLCEITLCQRPDHLEAVSRAENTRRRHQRAKTIDRPAQEAKAVQRFAVALFAGIDRPTVEQQSVTLDELITLLTRFETLRDKRGGRCWSPTSYADGATSRGNAGVESVSCLVFDLDRVPPDPKRLDGVRWIGHTTWSHKPSAPRWRVVVPLSKPVPARQWANIWQRARAALCPEADPSCKDPSRQYYLPSCPIGVTPDSSHHPGPPLDPRTLPDLPAPPRRAAAPGPRTVRVGDQRRADAYMSQVVENVATAVSGSRNAALNRAAWTLGRWIGASVLDQTTVENALFAAAERSGLVADDGERQCWATIRSGLSAGLCDPIDLRS